MTRDEIWKRVRERAYWGDVEPPDNPKDLPFREKAKVFWRLLFRGASALELNAIFGESVCREIVEETSREIENWPPLSLKVKSARAIWLGEEPTLPWIDRSSMSSREK